MITMSVGYVGTVQYLLRSGKVSNPEVPWARVVLTSNKQSQRTLATRRRSEHGH